MADDLLALCFQDSKSKPNLFYRADLDSRFSTFLPDNPYRGYFLATRLQSRRINPELNVPAFDSLLLDLALSGETASPISRRSWQEWFSQACNKDFFEIKRCFLQKAKNFTIAQVKEFEGAFLDPQDPEAQAFLSYGHHFILFEFLRGGYLGRELSNIWLALANDRPLQIPDLLDVLKAGQWCNPHERIDYCDGSRDDTNNVAYVFCSSFIDFLKTCEGSRGLFPWDVSLLGDKSDLVDYLLDNMSEVLLSSRGQFMKDFTIALFQRTLFGPDSPADIRDRCYYNAVAAIARNVRKHEAKVEAKTAFWDTILQDRHFAFLDFAREWSISSKDTNDLRSRAAEIVLFERDSDYDGTIDDLTFITLYPYCILHFFQAIRDSKKNNEEESREQIILNHALSLLDGTARLTGFQGNKDKLRSLSAAIIQKCRPKTYTLLRQVSKFCNIHNIHKEEDLQAYVQTWSRLKAGA
ncbi:MAG: hypothetical protein LBJ89_00035 [Holosporales bacterium]|nr:hypothetical protein [Holosporales bacterium]